MSITANELDISDKDYIISKLNNLFNWLITDNIIETDHKFIYYLNHYCTDFDKFLNDMKLLSKFSDDKGNISDNLIGTFLNYYNIDINKFDNDVIIKFKRYLTFFILATNDLFN